ncbi:hypothetical protein FRC17_006495 [Serendipita sp. 399]|nr:hypothetical protein FRC17_006495 [Serendipita sp. 399]
MSPLQYQPQQHQQPMTVRLSPIPQDVPEDISLSGTPAALRPVSLAQSLAQKQRQMIMSIKPLRLGRTGGGRTSIDKSTIGKPKEIDQTRRHLSFEEDADADADTASSLAESKYMSMTMTAAEATFSHWWRPESSQTQAAAAAAVAPMPPVSRVQTQTTYPISSVHASPQVLRPTRSMSPPRAKQEVSGGGVGVVEVFDGDDDSAHSATKGSMEDVAAVTRGATASGSSGADGDHSDDGGSAAAADDGNGSGETADDEE